MLIALLIMVLFAMLGLAIDSGRAYVDRRDQQSAIDAAALAAGDWYENFQDRQAAARTPRYRRRRRSIRTTCICMPARPRTSGRTRWSASQASSNQDTEVFTYAGGY